MQVSNLSPSNFMFHKFFLNDNIDFVKTTAENSDLQKLLQDKDIWRWWSGGDGSLCMQDHLKSVEQQWFFMRTDGSGALWLGKQDTEHHMQVVFSPGVKNRIATSEMIDSVVRSLWSISWPCVQTTVAFNETNLLLSYCRAFFLSDLDHKIDVVKDELPQGITTLSRFSPERSHKNGPVW